MCDFAADAKAAEELMVGRTLTVARVRELNAKDYFYQMLKDNPEMLKIYPGIENELLRRRHRLPYPRLSRFRASLAGHDSDRHRSVEDAACAPSRSKTTGTSAPLRLI